MNRERVREEDGQQADTAPSGQLIAVGHNSRLLTSGKHPDCSSPPAASVFICAPRSRLTKLRTVSMLGYSLDRRRSGYVIEKSVVSTEGSCLQLPNEDLCLSDE